MELKWRLFRYERQKKWFRSEINAIFFRYFQNKSYICSEPIGYDYV